MNWSSVALWNCSYPANQAVTPEFIENAAGAQLHRFTWLADTLIGELPIEWNWQSEEFGPNQSATLLQHPLGTPYFHGYGDAPLGAEWRRERMLIDYFDQYRVKWLWQKGGNVTVRMSTTPTNRFL